MPHPSRRNLATKVPNSASLDPVRCHSRAIAWRNDDRTDRLYALVEELRGSAPRALSAHRLAERFEVGVRTIQRDILALQDAGVPVWATTGPGGGYTIDPATPCRR